MKKLWHDEAWEDYLYWQVQDKKCLKKINRLLKSIDIVDESLEIAECGSHYGDK